MPDPTQGQPTKLQRAYDFLKSKDVTVPENFVDFESAFAAEPEKRQRMYDYFKEQDVTVPEDFAEFEASMLDGVKKKELSGSGATPSYSSEAFPGFDSENVEVAAPLAQPGIGTVPAEVAMQPTGQAEQLQQPLPVSWDGYNGNTDQVSARQGIQAVPGDEQIAAGLPAPSIEELRAQQQGDAEDDSFLDTLGKSLYNSAGTPGARRVVGNLVDLAGDLWQGMQFPIGGVTDPFGAGQVTGGKATDQFGDEYRQMADAATKPTSSAAKQSILDNPGNGQAWAALLGQGAGSIAQVGAASLVGGPGAGASVGAGLSMSSTKDAAKQAGISDGEATTTAVLLAPVVGVLEELGLGFITKNKAATSVLQSELVKRALAYGQGKVTQSSLAQAVGALMPKIVTTFAKRAASGAVGEGATELLQGEAEGGAQLLADALRTEGEKGYGVSAFDALVKNPLEQGIAGALLGGAAGSLAGGPQQADINVGQSQPVQNLSEPVQPDRFEVPADVTPAEQQAAQQAYPAPVQIVRPTGQVMFPNAQVVALSPDGKMARIVGEDLSGQPVDTAVPVEYIAEQPTSQADATEQTAVPSEQLAVDDTASIQSGATGLQPQAPLPNQEAGSDLPTATPVVGDQPIAVSDSAGLDSERPALVDSSQGVGPVVDEQTLPAEEPTAPQEAPAEAISSQPNNPPLQAQGLISLTPEQERVNGVLDDVAGYKELSTRDRKGKKGQQARADLAKAAEAAGLDFEVGNDLAVKVTRGGKRVTRTNATTATSPVEGHVPARERAPEVRDAALTLAGRGGGDFVALGVQINGKRLSPRDAAAAAKDIQEGRNTLRADALLNTIQQIVETGYAEVSTGTGLATKKERVSAEDFFGNPDTSTIRSREEVELSDADIDALIADDPKVGEALADYTTGDGSINYQRLAETFQDPAGYTFVFGVDETTATKLKALVDERASQTRERANAPSGSQQEVPSNDARAEAGSIPQAASPATGSQQQEVAPTLREQNEAAKAEFNDALAEFRAARKQKSGRAYSSVLGITPFSAAESAAIQKMVRALIKRGAISTKRVVAGMRELGLTQDDATDDQLAPVVKQALKEAGVFRAKAKSPTEASLTDNAKERKSMQRLKADPAQPDALKQQVIATKLDKYEPRSLADAATAAELEIQRLGVEAAAVLAIAPPSTMHGDVKTALRVGVMEALNAQSDAALTANDQVEAERLYDLTLAVAEALAKTGTDLGQQINAYKLLARHSPAAAVVEAQREVKAQRDKKLAKTADKAKKVAARARTVQKEAVNATLSSPAIAKAKEALAGDATATTVKEPTAYGAKNKLFTKDGLAKLRKATGGMLFSAPVSPVVIYEGAYHLEAGVRKFADWSAKMIRSYGAGIRPRLAEIYDLSKEKYVTEGGDPTLVQSAADVEDAIAQQQAEMLAARILAVAKQKATPGPLDPVQQLLNTLTAKVTEKLPSKGSTKPSPREAIITALRNQAEYADVWERAKDQVQADITANTKLSQSQKDDLLDRLETFFAETIGQSYATKQATQVVRTGLKELNATLDTIVRTHATKQDATGRTLVQKLVQEAGLTFAEADAYAAVVEKEFQRQLQAKRTSILDRMHSRLGAVLPPRKTKTALDKLFETLNLSPVSDQRVAEILQAQLDLPTLTPQDVQNLRKLAEAVQAAPEGSQKTAAVANLLAAQKRIQGISLIEMGNALWYANGLVGPKTHGMNIYTAGLAVIEENFISLLYQVGRTKGNVVKATASLRGIQPGFAQGQRDARYIMQTGYDVYSDYKVEVPSELEVYKSLDPEAYEGVKKVWAYLTKYPAMMKFVGRALRAEDAFFTGGAKEMRAWEYAMMEADRQYKGQPTKEIIQKAHEKLYGTKERFTQAEDQARAEGMTGRDFKRRVFELVEESRPVEMREENLRWARRTVFNSEPKGTVGAFAALISKAGRLSIYGFRPLMFVVPYTRVPANIANRALEYTPLGYARALKGGVGFNNDTYGTYFDPYSPEEKAKACIRATLGLATIGLLYALSHDKDEEGEPALEIVGYGPRDFTKRQEWMQNGGMPYSVRKRGSKTYVSYQGWPNAAALVAAGTIRDMEIYERKTWEDRSFAGQALVLAVKQAQYNMNLTSTRGLYEGLDAFNNPNSDALVKYGQRLVGNSAKNFVLPASALFTQTSKTAQSIFDMPKKEVDGVLDVLIQDIPYARTGLVDAVDALGDPIIADTDRLLSSPSPRPAESQAIWDVLLKKGIFISLPDRRSLTVADLTTKTETYATQQQYHDFLQRRGYYLKMVLTAGVLDKIRAASKVEAQKFINRVLIPQANKAAKQDVFGAGAFVKLPEPEGD